MNISVLVERDGSAWVSSGEGYDRGSRFDLVGAFCAGARVTSRELFAGRTMLEIECPNDPVQAVGASDLPPATEPQVQPAATDSSADATPLTNDERPWTLRIQATEDVVVNLSIRPKPTDFSYSIVRQFRNPQQTS